MTALEKTFFRFAALLDGSAWMTMAPALIALFFIDAPMATTLLQWSLYFLVVVGVALMLSRIAFPHIRLQRFIDGAAKGDVACAIMVFSVVLFVGVLIVSFVLWARPAAGA